MNGSFAGPIADAFQLLPGYLGSHVLVSVTALALGLAVSLPLAIVSAQRPALRGVLLAIASPSLGLDFEGRLRGVTAHKNAIGSFAALAFLVALGGLGASGGSSLRGYSAFGSDPRIWSGCAATASTASPSERRRSRALRAAHRRRHL